MWMGWNNKHLFLGMLFIAVSTLLFSQETGIIRGKVVDDITGETILGATVVIEGTTNGSATDFDGNYSLKADPGTYTLEFSFISYNKKKISDVFVKSGEVTIIDVRLKEAALGLEEVIITATQTRNTESSLLTIQRKSANLLDGLSSQTFRKMGDPNVAEAVKRVTGVSVEGGKYIYVRGLGDRYTKTVLNKVEIPSLDPDRNNVQMDIFPTNLIDNVLVYKTFTPDLQGDFTGGMVDIQTKDFPERKTINAQIGLGYTPGMNFNKEYISYDGGKLDWLGFDDGTRKLPIYKGTPFPDPTDNDPYLTNLTQSFGQQMAVQKKSSFLNQTYSFGMGNQKNLSRFDYGYNFAVNYQNNYQYFDNVIYNEYRKDPETINNELFIDRSSKGPLGEHDVLWSGLIGQSVKTKKHQVSLTAFHTQNGTSRAAKFTQINYETNPAILIKDNLTYNQRAVTNLSLIGKHNLSKKWEIDWLGAYTHSGISDPDIRSTALELEDGIFILNQSVGAEIRRIFRDLKENNYTARIDFTYNFKQWLGLESKVKFGVLENYKKRNFEILDYIFNVEKYSVFNGDPNWFFQNENIWTAETDSGTYGTGQIEPANNFVADQNVLAFYAMNELPISNKLKLIYGLRTEMAKIHYTGQNNSGTEIYTDSLVLNELDFLPALNMIYALTDRMNIRTSVSKTLARPSFKEKSIAQIYDPIQGRRYNGNIDLEETQIINGDLRWEYFITPSEIFSISGFYKNFEKPIEMASFDLAPDEIKPVNAGTANLYGIELEVRKDLSFIKKGWENLMLGTNFTWVKSKIDTREVIIKKGNNVESEYLIRQSNAREGEIVSVYRPMFGQAPYIINTYLNYTHVSTGINVNLSYNVQGKSLAVVGIGSLPNVYNQPFHAVNFKASKDFGEDHRWQGSITVQNILNSKRQQFYESYQATSQIYSLLNPGRAFSMALRYTLK